MFRSILALLLASSSAAFAGVQSPIMFINHTADPTSVYPLGMSTVDFSLYPVPIIQFSIHARSWNTRVDDVRFSISGTEKPQSAAAEAMVSCWSKDNVTTSDCNGSHYDTRAYHVYEGGSNIDAANIFGAYTGYFTTDLLYSSPIDTVVASAYMALRQAGISHDTYFFKITSRSSSSAIALCSFYMVVAGGNNGQANGENAGTATSAAVMSVGFWANDSSTQWSVSYGAEDNQGTTDTYRQFNKGQVAVVWDANSFEAACDTAWIGDSAGTQYIYWTDNTSGDWSLYVLGINDYGVNPQAGWSTMRTSTGTQTVTTAGQPCNLIVGSALATAGGSQDGGYGVLGMGTYYNTGMAAKQASLSWVDGHGLDVSNSWTYMDSSNIMSASDDTDGTMEVVAHMEAFNATSFQLDYTAAPGTAYDFGWVYLGGTGDTLVASTKRYLWFFPD